MHVNLLPSSFVWQQLLRKRLRQWACALAGLTIVWIVANAPLIIQWWVDLQEHQTMQLAAEPARELQDNRIEIAKATLGLKQKIESLQALTARDRGTSLLGLIANSVNATDKTVQIQQLHVNIETKSLEVQPANPTVISTANPARTNLPTVSNVLENQVRLTLKGIAVESESISKFADAIQRSRVFPKVELRSTQERVVQDRSIQDFELECFANE
jgi:Tfp pilus assembly protein PilN